MLNRILRKSFSALAAFAVLTLGNVAHASLWSSDYDPPELVGTGVFEVPTVCLTGKADGQYLPSSTVGCSISVVSNVTTTPVINFNSILPSFLVTSYEVIGGKFVGVNTGVIGFVTVSLTDYWFQFSSTFIPGSGCNTWHSYYAYGCTPTAPSVTNLVRVFSGCNEQGTNCTTTLSAREVSFAVPEPGSIGLILSALGAGWMARRRKVAS